MFNTNNVLARFQPKNVAQCFTRNIFRIQKIHHFYRIFYKDKQWPIRTIHILTVTQGRA